MADDWVTLGGSCREFGRRLLTLALVAKEAVRLIVSADTGARRPFLKGSGRATRLIWTPVWFSRSPFPPGAARYTGASAQGSGEIFGTSCPTTQMCVSVGTRTRMTTLPT